MQRLLPFPHRWRHLKLRVPFFVSCLWTALCHALGPWHKEYVTSVLCHCLGSLEFLNHPWYAGMWVEQSSRAWEFNFRVCDTSGSQVAQLDLCGRSISYTLCFLLTGQVQGRQNHELHVQWCSFFCFCIFCNAQLVSVLFPWADHQEAPWAAGGAVSPSAMCSAGDGSQRGNRILQCVSVCLLD